MTPNCRLFLGFLRQQLDSGIENGKLTARYYALEKDAGITYNKIRDVVREAVHLKLVEITFARKGAATTYRIIESGERFEKQT